MPYASKWMSRSNSPNSVGESVIIYEFIESLGKGLAAPLDLRAIPHKLDY